MPRLVCEICGSTAEVVTLQGYGLNQIICQRCAGPIVAAQNAEEWAILRENRSRIVNVIAAKRKAMKRVHNELGKLPTDVREGLIRG